MQTSQVFAWRVTNFEVQEILAGSRSNIQYAVGLTRSDTILR